MTKAARNREREKCRRRAAQFLDQSPTAVSARFLRHWIRSLADAFLRERTEAYSVGRKEGWYEHAAETPGSKQFWDLHRKHEALQLAVRAYLTAGEAERPGRLRELGSLLAPTSATEPSPPRSRSRT